MSEFKLTEEQHKVAKNLWYRFFDVFDIGTITDEKRAIPLLKDIQNFFNDIGYENGVWCVESVLLKGEDAVDWDYDGIKGLLHTFVESFSSSKRETLELSGETLKLELQEKGVNLETYFSKQSTNLL